jgi:integrase
MIPLSRLEPMHLQSFYAELNGKLSSQSILHIHRCIHNALEAAMRWGKVQRNVADLVKPPRVTRKELTVWDETQLRTFLRVAKGHRLYVAFLLAASTGMRQGEILGLRWADVDLEKGTISVRQALSKDYSGFAIQETKTESSIRTVAIPPNVVAELRKHRIRQMEERLAAKTYTDHGLVIQSTVGTPVLPRNLKRVWYRLLEESGVPKIRFHDLRHTHATLLLKAGVHPKVVSERLGHSSVQITLDTYSHLLPNMQEAAALRFGELLEGHSQQASEV